MIKRIAILILSQLLLINAFSQSGDTRESFLNAVSGKVVNSSFTRYFISANCSRLYGILDTLELRISYPSYRSDIAPDILIELALKAKQDTLPLTWDCSRIPRSVCVSPDSASLITGSAYHVTLKKAWSRRRKIRERDKQVQEQALEKKKIPAQDRIVYYFSRPVFSSSGEFAMIAMGSGCGSLCGSGCTYVFKKTNGHWTLLFEASCWVS